MSDLYQRLKALREQRSRSTPRHSSDLIESTQSNLAFYPEKDGWESCGEQVWSRSLELPVSQNFWNMLGISADKLEAAVTESEGVFCLDTETTGLSGGAGTVPFLIGWCQLQGDRAIVRQFFLQDFGGEPDLIRAVETELSSAQVLSTYNGASFDLPLLRMRWALQGREFPPLVHEDSLHPARRLWRRGLGGCSLQRVERAVFGVERHNDVPGALVPQMYFEYLRSGAGNDFAVKLQGIFGHHVQDVFSLMLLRILLAAIRKDPLNPGWVTRLEHATLDPWGLMAWCNSDQKIALAKSQWEMTHEPKWGLAYAALCRTSGSPQVYAEARAVWQELWQRNRDHRALVAWLKMVEHRNRNPLLWEEALREIELAQKVLVSLPDVCQDLARRSERLKRCLLRVAT